jgi:hypothetical protein
VPPSENIAVQKFSNFIEQFGSIFHRCIVLTEIGDINLYIYLSFPLGRDRSGSVENYVPNYFERRFC